MTIKRTPTTERLAQALEALKDDRLAEIIKKARAGYYDDFKSPLTMPEMQLIADLKPFGHPEFIERVIHGEFDAREWESKEWAESPEGQAVFAELIEKGKSNDQA